MINDEQWYKISDIVKLAKEGFVPFRSPGTWYRIIQSGKLKHIVKGEEDSTRTFIIQGRDIKEYLESLKVTNV